MIKRIIILAVFVVPILAFGQHGNNWTVGTNAGISFNTSPPSLFQSAQTAYSGKQSISNCKGELMFYAFKNYIWNRFHNRIPNDSVVLGKMTLPYFFIPCPNDDSSFYYICTYGATNATSEYAILDLRLDSGRGAIRNSQFVKLNDSVSKCSGFIKHANDTDYWLLVRYNYYYLRAYKVTTNGIDTNYVQSPFIGSLSNGQDNYLRASNNGNMIVSTYANGAVGSKYTYYIYDFDRATGKTGNARMLVDKAINIVLEHFTFSPNDSIVYGFSNYYTKDSSALYQLSTYNPVVKVKPLTKFIGYSAFFAAQLAPDNKIYISNTAVNKKQEYLSCILYPDKWGTACNFYESYFSTYPYDPNGVIFPCLQFPVKRISPQFNVSNGGCGYDTLRFTFDGDSAFKSYHWYFGDGDSATGKSIVHQYKNAGCYYVKLGCELGNCGYMQWVGDSVTIKFKPTVSLSTNKNIYCGYQTVAAKVNYRYSDTMQIAWGDGKDTLLYVADTNLVDSVQLQHTYTKSGNYALSCKAWNSNCYDSVATVYNIIIDTLPKSSFAADYITSCGAKSIVLSDTSKFDSIIVNRTWHIYKASGLDTTITTGTTNQLSFLFNDTGVYSAKLIIQSRQGCIDSLEKTNYIQINPIPVSKITGKKSWCGTDSTTLTVTGGMGYIWSNGDTTASIFLKPVTSNYYSVVVTNVYNCSVKDSVYISVGKIVTPFFASNYITSCGNSTITLTDSSGGRDSIIQQRKWTIEFPNNIIKQYDTASSNKLKLIVQDTGYYNAKLVYIAKQGCLDSLYKTKVFRILPQPAVYIDSPSHNPLCFGDSFMLTAQQRDTAYPPLVSYKWNTGQVSTKSIKVDSANSYYVAAINSVGCGAQSNTVKISFLPQLFANIKKATDSLYVVTTRKIISYSWHKDSIVYNTSSSLYHPPSGRYYVQVMDANGCEASSGSLLYTTNIGYIGEEENGIRVYPNPASDILYVEWSSHVGNGSTPLTTTNMRQSGKTTILMYDMLGRCAIQLVGDGSTPLTTTNQRQHTIYVGDLPKGFYILRVGENPDSYRVKVLVE